jgi:hypothetical protein
VTTDAPVSALSNFQGPASTVTPPPILMQASAAGMSGAKCRTMREDIGTGYRFHLRAPGFGGLEAAKAPRPSVGGEILLAQDMHVVERITAAMDVAGASIIVGWQCRFATSDTLRLIIINSRSHSVSTG